MSKKSRRRDRRDRRVMRYRAEVIHAAATAFGHEKYESIEELWALCVFFERYIAFGGNGTRKEFGPVKPKKAKVLKLVRAGQ